jgi:hypothetical protein
LLMPERATGRARSSYMRRTARRVCCPLRRHNPWYVKGVLTVAPRPGSSRSTAARCGSAWPDVY